LRIQSHMQKLFLIVLRKTDEVVECWNNGIRFSAQKTYYPITRKN
jgi:hypothetical protein